MNNQLRTVLLLGVLSGLLLGIGLLAGGRVGLTIALFFAIIINLVSFWYSGRIALFMYGAKEADKNTYAKLYHFVEDTSKKANIPAPRVYIIKGNASNAFATGRNYKNSYVAFTEGILKSLDENELKGVIAHELSHIKNRDILIASIAAVIASAISYLALIGRIGILFGNRDGESSNWIEMLLLLVLTPIIAMFIQLAISRSREFVADATAAKILKDSGGLSRALYKLENSDKTDFHGSKAGASLFIVNPFSGKSIINLLSTHPPISERIRRLELINF